MAGRFGATFNFGVREIITSTYGEKDIRICLHVQ